MPTYAEFVGWVISTLAGWFVVTADIYARERQRNGRLSDKLGSLIVGQMNGAFS
jgi:hypothetical protein